MHLHYSNKRISFLSEFNFEELNIYLQIYKSIVDCIQCQESDNKNNDSV